MYSICKLICFFIIFSFYNVRSQRYEGSPCEHNGVNGTCVPAYRCKSIVYDIKYGSNPKTCSFNGKVPIVCCTDCELVDDASKFVVDSHGLHQNKTGQKAHDMCLEYLVNLDYKCMTSFGDRRVLSKTCHRYVLLNISAAVGGRPAQGGEYPHMALLGYGNDLDSAQWRCGGSVISEKFILTAGHCTGDRLGSVKYVALGILKRSDPPEKWQIYDVKNITSYPEYRSPAKYHDIALIEVKTRIIFSPNVLPACLNTGGYNEQTATASGWGNMGPTASPADTLQVVNLEKYTDFICAIMHRPDRLLERGYDAATQSCYGNNKKISDTCQGDSGGPLQIRSPYKGCMSVIIGITSNGDACGTLGYAGLYTRVSYYISWIESIVWP